jgi:hypothetical protein
LTILSTQGYSGGKQMREPAVVDVRSLTTGEGTHMTSKSGSSGDLNRRGVGVG